MEDIFNFTKVSTEEEIVHHGESKISVIFSEATKDVNGMLENTTERRVLCRRDLLRSGDADALAVLLEYDAVRLKK